MTICAAAMCMKNDRRIILCVADRMLTVGDLEFEAGSSKAYGFAPAYILGLVAGDVAHHMTIASRAHQMVIAAGTMTVEEVASAYAWHFSELRSKIAERLYLTPIGLDFSQFQVQLGAVNPAIAASLVKKLTEADLEISTIIAGVDATGAHLYKVDDPGQESCYDQSGFVAVGLGARHFDAAFTSMNYSRTWDWLPTLLLLYTAKKKAESAPGVGTRTDLFMISEVTSEKIDAALFYALDQHYKDFEKKTSAAWSETIERMSKDEKITGQKDPPKEAKNEGGTSAAGQG